MANIILPNDFKEFLKLLNARGVEYLLIGGYAVGHYGYPRYTADMDIWIAAHPATAERMVAAMRDFGFDLPTLTPDLFLQERNIVRMMEDTGWSPLSLQRPPGIAASISAISRIVSLSAMSCWEARI